MRFFGEASGTGDIQERDGLLLIDSGVNYAVFNIAMFSQTIDTADALARCLSEAGSYFAARRTRWSIWVCEQMLSTGVRKRAPAMFAGKGLRRLTEAPGMIADRIHPAQRALPTIECRAVNDAATRANFAHLTSLNFDIPFATCRAVYTNPKAWQHDYRGYVGYHAGVAVATVAAVEAAGSTGIYSVGTLPQHRRKGYAEALMRTVIAEYTRSTGIERTVLQATRAGCEMYRKMGYRTAAHFTVYMS